MSFITPLLDLLFPPKCVFCGKVLSKVDEGWCVKCTHTLPFTDNFGKQDGIHHVFCISPLHYSGIVRRSVLRFKFKGACAHAEAYGKLLAECIRSCPDLDYNLISWVPLSSKRERSRGYDQAMLLALATALELSDVAVETLKKPHDVQAQSELVGKEQRSSNISGAYEPTDPELISGKCILLIDDIVTTGATLDECAKVLHAAGARKVICAALARGD